MALAMSLPYFPMPLMKEKLDLFEFSRDRRVFQESIDLVEFARLSDVLLEVGGALDVKLEGSRDTDGFSWLMMAVSGTLVLTCQRCLGRLQFPLRVGAHLQLIAKGTDLPDDELENDKFDVLVADEPLSIKDLVEDEVILALPVSPMHENCQVPDVGTNGKALSPFAALAQLKKH